MAFSSQDSLAWDWRVINVPNITNNWVYTVPANNLLEVINVTCLFITSATVANRVFTLRSSSSLHPANSYWTSLQSSFFVHAASLSIFYCWQADTGFSGAGAGAPGYDPIMNIDFGYLPPKMILLPGDTLFSSVRNLQVGDAFTGIDITCRNYRSYVPVAYS